MFQLEIDTGNAAFREQGLEREIVRILRECAVAVELGTETGKLFDINGNSVGTFTLTKRRVQE
jgi:hypothetical protein